MKINFHNCRIEQLMRALPLAVVVLMATAPALADVDSFKTPSGNIGCTIGIGDGLPSDIECTIFERSGPPAMPHLARCNEGLGHQFSMRERGAVTVKCGQSGSRPVSPSLGDDILRYGDTKKFGGIVCRSSKSGLDCSNSDGHGFYLSRGRQSVY